MMRRAFLIALAAMLHLAAIDALALPIEASISTEHCYGLYVGEAAGDDLTLVGSNCGTSLTTGPQRSDGGVDRYAFELSGRQQIFLAVWGGANAADGLLAQFETEGLRLMSGDGAWRVFASGRSRGAGDAPPHAAEMRRMLREANAGNAWQEIHTGARNDAALRGLVSDIDSEARWMWVRQPDGATALDRAGSGSSECLIFRTVIFDQWPETELYTQTALGGTPLALGLTGRGVGRRPMPVAYGGGGTTGGGSAGGASGGNSMRTMSPPELYDPPPIVLPPMTDTPPLDDTPTTTRKDPTPDPSVPSAGDPTPTPPAGPNEAPPTPANPPKPQPVPEPSTLLALALAWPLLRRR